MASQGWIADRLEDWVKKNPGVGAKAARGKLQDDYNIKLEYNKTWHGMQVALNQIHGSYEDNFPLLFKPGHMKKTCKAPDPKYVAVDDDYIPEDVPDPCTPTNKR